MKSSAKTVECWRILRVMCIHNSRAMDRIWFSDCSAYGQRNLAWLVSKRRHRKNVLDSQGRNPTKACARQGKSKTVANEHGKEYERKIRIWFTDFSAYTQRNVAWLVSKEPARKISLNHQRRNQSEPGGRRDKRKRNLACLGRENWQFWPVLKNSHNFWLVWRNFKRMVRLRRERKNLSETWK